MSADSCNIVHLMNRLYFTDNIIVAKDTTSVYMNGGEVKVVRVEKMMQECHFDIT